MFVCRSASLALLISTAGLAQQDPETLAKAVAVWVDSDQVDAALLAQTVKLVLDDKAGLQWLGAQQPPTLARHDEKASKAIAALSLHVLLGFLERAKNSGMVFRGQYEPLRALLPVATNTLFELLLRTPDWFPFSERSRLLPAIRDLQPECPDDRRLTGVVEIAENTGLESEAFRVEVACLLWQWGRKEYLMPCIDELKQQTMEGDAENRLVALRALAKLWYEVAEYQKAAMVHSSLKKTAEVARQKLAPTDWYWSACCQSMLGEVDRGIAALLECAALQASDTVDESRKLPRKLFEQDPEVAKLRADPRFVDVLKLAFPKASSERGRRP
ncbi:MAG: hypothetical protein WCR59_01255 [Planctomycetota bacterium]|jgi:hypothetical protein